jgi:hypothetical protein
MDLHEELERRARLASAAAADRLGALSAGDTLVALVGRRRRRRATVVTGASVACVAALVVAAVYVGPWSPSAVAPAGPPATATTVIDASTPYVAVPFPSTDGLPVACGNEYAVSSGASRQADAAERWPLSITASASLSGGNDGVFTAAPGMVTWDVQVASTGSVRDLSLVTYGVVESNGIVVGSATLGVQPLIASGVVPTREAPMPGACAGQDNWHDSPDGDYTFHLWVQLVDASFTAVATVVDPVPPTTLKVAGIAKSWGDALAIDGLPNVEFVPIKCGDPSPVEGRSWGDNGLVSTSLPAGSSASFDLSALSADPIDTSLDAASVPSPVDTNTSEGVWRYVAVRLSSDLLPGTFPVAQGFAVADGVVVAVGEVQSGPRALDYNQPLHVTAPCGVTNPSATEVYVLELALDYGYSTPQGAAVIKVG